MSKSFSEGMPTTYDHELSPFCDGFGSKSTNTDSFSPKFVLLRQCARKKEKRVLRQFTRVVSHQCVFCSFFDVYSTKQLDRFRFRFSAIFFGDIFWIHSPPQPTAAAAAAGRRAIACRLSCHTCRPAAAACHDGLLFSLFQSLSKHKQQLKQRR